MARSGLAARCIQVSRQASAWRRVASRATFASRSSFSITLHFQFLLSDEIFIRAHSARCSELSRTVLGGVRPSLAARERAAHFAISSRRSKTSTRSNSVILQFSCQSIRFFGTSRCARRKREGSTEPRAIEMYRLADSLCALLSQNRPIISHGDPFVSRS